MPSEAVAKGGRPTQHVDLPNSESAPK